MFITNNRASFDKTSKVSYILTMTVVMSSVGIYISKKDLKRRPQKQKNIRFLPKDC